MTDMDMETVAVMCGLAAIVYIAGTITLLCIGHDRNTGTLGHRVAGWLLAIPMILIVLALSVAGAVLVFHLVIGGITA